MFFSGKSSGQGEQFYKAAEKSHAPREFICDSISNVSHILKISSKGLQQAIDFYNSQN
tara:strand:- start:288 stop:461 length:174 start_codon:yes stop_codon:yes gene_type:complete